MNREQRRALKKKGIDDAEIELSDKIFLFNQIPEECSSCEIPFDKKDKSMAFSWKVVIRDKTIRLFCPACLNKVQEAINEHQKD
jgi:hypothetical protein|tara:strand:+ start:737 stop:988 length:252 start_codon:yes stop_codon:yes gene_type:complete